MTERRTEWLLGDNTVMKHDELDEHRLRSSTSTKAYTTCGLYIPIAKHDKVDKRNAHNDAVKPKGASCLAKHLRDSAFTGRVQTKVCWWLDGETLRLPHIYMLIVLLSTWLTRSCWGGEDFGDCIAVLIFLCNEYFGGSCAEIHDLFCEWKVCFNALSESASILVLPSARQIH